MLNHRNNPIGILINLSWSSLQAFLEPSWIARILKINYLYQVVKSPALLPISQISRDLIQRRRGEFDMAAPISLRGDFDGPMLRALVLAEKAGSVTRRLLSLVTIYDGGSRADAA